MENFTILLLIVVFLFTVSLVAVVYLAWTESRFAERYKIKRRLLYISAGGKHGQEKLLNYRERVLRDVGIWERFALQLPRFSTLDRMLLKAGFHFNATSFVLISLFLGILGFVAGLKFLPQVLAAVVFGLLTALIPWAYLKVAERRYYEKFHDQLPEALDLLSRALKSGHSLSSGLEMISTDMPEPIKSEFGAVVDETNLGLTLDEAFSNLCNRINDTDLRFFTIAILIQKQTGGNVSEILDNISRLIRERIQFSRQVRALTAEGRLSAWVLIGLPIFMFLYMYIVKFDYISLLWTDQTGIIMLVGAIILQIIGAFIIRKIVDVEI